MNNEYVNVKLTWNAGYSKVVKMSRYSYNHYVRERNFITRGYHCIDWSSDDGKLGVSFNGLIAMEIVDGLDVLLSTISENGFYCEYGYIPPHNIYRIDIFRKEILYYDEDKNCFSVKLSDYQKTWWLKEDCSE